MKKFLVIILLLLASALYADDYLKKTSGSGTYKVIFDDDYLWLSGGNADQDLDMGAFSISADTYYATGTGTSEFNDAVHFYDTFYAGSTDQLTIDASGNVSTSGTLGAGAITGTSLIKSGGVSSEFLKADGSVDSTAYVSGTPWTGEGYITLASLSGTSPISYNNGTGAISFLFNTNNTWTGTNTFYNTYIEGDTANRVISMNRETTAATPGRNLTINAGGATSGSTDKAGGGLYLTAGTSTGKGEGHIYLQAPVSGASGTTDRAVSSIITIDGSSVTFSPQINVFQNAVATRDIISLSLSTTATPLGSEFLRGMKCSSYLSNSGGYSHVFCGGYFQGGFVNIGFGIDPFPGGQTQLALGGYFSGYVTETGTNKFDDNLTQIGGWFTTDGTISGTGTSQHLGAYCEKDFMLKSDQKLILEGTASLSTKAVTIGDTYFIFNSSSTDVDLYVDNTQVINFDNDLIDAKVALKGSGGFQSSDGTAGATADVDTAKVGGGTRTLHFKNGLYTGYTDS